MAGRALNTARPTSAHSGESLRVLLAVADPSRADRLRALVLSAGGRALPVHGVDELLAQLDGSDPPPVLLIDEALGDLGAVGGYAGLRARSRQPYTYVVALPSEGGSGDPRLDGADDVLDGRVGLRRLRAALSAARRVIDAVDRAGADVSGELALARFRSVLDRTGDAIFVSKASDASLVDVNSLASRWTGLERGELLDAGLPRLILGLGLEDDRGWRAHIGAVRAAAAPLLFERAQMIRREGGSFPVEVVVSLHIIQGVEYAVSVVRDIGTRARAEEELRIVKAAVDQAAEGIFRLDAAGRVKFLNPAAHRMLGRDRAELLGRPIWEHDESLDPESYARLFRRVRRDGPVTYESRYRRESGDLIPVELSVTPFDHDGATECHLFVREISERKRLEAQVSLAERLTAVGTLAAGVAHELNNPLAYVMQNLEFSREELEGTPSPAALAEVRQALSEAFEGTKRMRDVVLDLKTFSRTEDDDQARVDVDRAIDLAIRMTKNEVRHRAELIEDRRPTLPVSGNESKLAQVFVNLLINAVHAMPDRPVHDNHIHIRTRADGDWVYVEIEDNGVGIEEQHLARVFDPFFTTKPVGVGTGLGLSVCHGVVTALGGRISVDSKRGRGASFRVALPISRFHAPPPPPIARQPGGRRRVLIVDDEPLLLASYRRVLEPAHEVVVEVESRAALERLRSDRSFDLVLCDLMMPRLSGMDLYERVAEQDPKLAERFVFITGGVFTPRMSEFAAAHQARVYSKPLDRETLIALLERR